MSSAKNSFLSFLIVIIGLIFTILGTLVFGASFFSDGQNLQFLNSILNNGESTSVAALLLTTGLLLLVLSISARLHFVVAGLALLVVAANFFTFSTFTESKLKPIKDRKLAETFDYDKIPYLDLSNDTASQEFTLSTDETGAYFKFSIEQTSLIKIDTGGNSYVTTVNQPTLFSSHQVFKYGADDDPKSLSSLSPVISNSYLNSFAVIEPGSYVLKVYVSDVLVDETNSFSLSTYPGRRIDREKKLTVNLFSPRSKGAEVVSIANIPVKLPNDVLSVGGIRWFEIDSTMLLNQPDKCLGIEVFSISHDTELYLFHVAPDGNLGAKISENDDLYANQEFINAAGYHAKLYLDNSDYVGSFLFLHADDLKTEADIQSDRIFAAVRMYNSTEEGSFRLAVHASERLENGFCKEPEALLFAPWHDFAR